MHALHGSRERRAGAGVHQGVPDGLPALWQQGRHAGAGGATVETVEGQLQFSECGRLRSEGRWRHGRDLRVARCDAAGTLWRVAEQSNDSADGEIVERAAEVAWKCGDGGQFDRIVRALFAVWTERPR